MIKVQIYIKKNTLVKTGAVTTANVSPYTQVKDAGGAYTTNQYIGHYIKITKGFGLGKISYIVSNNTDTLTLQTGIQTDTTTKFEIYRADYQELDLYKAEKISVTSQIASVNDIGKVFTDFSQSFTIPASERNNQILSHWYESSVDNGFDHRVRYDGYIEINTQRFKNGNFQLEKASKKNGFIESYTVTFYGNLTQLKDIIQDDKLASLNFTIYNHLFDSSNVIARITSATTTGDIKYPLIGSTRKFYYQDVIHASEDVTTNTGSIKWNELFPAIKISNIFLKIKEKYGVEFTGSFLNEDQYKKLYLYLKPTTNFVFKPEELKLNFTSTSGVAFPEMDLVTDTLKFSWGFAPVAYVTSETIAFSLKITPSAGYTTVPYTIFIYRNGVLFNTLNYTGTADFLVTGATRYNDGTPLHAFTFSVSSLVTFNFIPQIFYTRRYYITTTGAYVYLQSYATSGVQTTDPNIQIVKYMPDMKISDFLTGIIKAFNLVIVPMGNNVYDLSHLETYYNVGKVTDITKYVYANEMEIEKPKLFKSINFKYEESANVLNRYYKGLYGTEYGDLIYNPISSNESATFDIKLPFENVMFERTGLTEFETATIIDKDLKPYTPKPMLIYCNGINATALTGTNRIIINTGVGYTPITFYNRFSNEYNSLPTDVSYAGLMTMNFGNEQSPWYYVLAPQGLYYRQYKNYIDNLYNIKTRIVKVKALFPPSIMTSFVNKGNTKAGIALNDRLIIRNKRYIIITMTTDLTSGETNLELITDYRGINASSSVGYKFATYGNLELGKEAVNFESIIYLNDYDSFGIKGATNFLSYPTSGTYEYSDIVLPISVPANASGVDRYDRVGIEYYKDGAIVLTEDIVVLQLAI